MRIDVIESPEFVGRYAVIDLANSEEIDGIAWADDEAGTYATFVMRPRKLDEPADADRRMRNPDGSFVLRERRGEIEIVDVTVSPFKAELLALFDDRDVEDKLVELVKLVMSRPDVADKLVELIMSRVVICGPVVDRKAVAQEVERVLGGMVRRPA